MRRDIAPSSKSNTTKNLETLWIIWNIFTSFSRVYPFLLSGVFFFFLNRITRHHLITLYDPSSASRASQRDAARDDETTQSASLHVDVDNEKTGNNLEGLFLYQSIFLSLKGWQKTNVFFRLAHTLFPQLICIHHTSGEVTGWWSRRDTLKIGRRKIFPSFNSPGGA